jgi:serine/threonine-protein kinase
MGIVYEAYEETLARVVALKVLPPELLRDADFAARFTREARVVASLEHPNIVPMFASGIDEGIPWMSMRLLRGGSLAALLSRGRLERTRAMSILRGVADALDYAHRQGVVHRDVKPSNILLDPAGRAFVADFGLAQLTEGVHGSAMIAAGTPQYMSPEQGIGRALDQRCDIYSLGVVAYEMLSGIRPFEGRTVSLITRHLNDRVPVPSPALVPRLTFAVLERALAKDPGDRLPSTIEFVKALERGNHAPVQRRAMPSLVRVFKGAAVSAVIAAVLAGFFVFGPRVARDPADSPQGQTAPEPEPGTDTPARTREPKRGAQQPTPGAKPVAKPAIPSPPPVERETVKGPSPPTSSGQSLDVGVVGDSRVPKRDTSPEDTPLVTEPIQVTSSTPPVLQPADQGSSRKPETVLVEPQRIESPGIEYPAQAERLRIEGRVGLTVIVGPDGRVTKVQVIRRAHPVLDDAAERIVRQSRYKPGTRNGVPDTFEVEVSVLFTLPPR